MHPKTAVDAIVLTVSISPAQLDEALSGKISREERMVALYGEACQKKTAAKILDCKAPSTISAMLADGRLKSACEGERVDVRSIAAYIENRPMANQKARKQPKGAVMAV